LEHVGEVQEHVHSQWPWLVPVHVLLYFTHMFQVSATLRSVFVTVNTGDSDGG